jgi:hypothetical protein
MKLKSFCTTKEMVTRLKRKLTEWEKVFAGSVSEKVLIIRIYTDLKKKKTVKKSMPNEEMSKWSEQSIFNGRSPND